MYDKELDLNADASDEEEMYVMLFIDFCDSNQFIAHPPEGSNESEKPQHVWIKSGKLLEF